MARHDTLDKQVFFYITTTKKILLSKSEITLQAFLDFRGFPFTAVYNSILFSSPLVLQSNLDLRGFSFGSPH